jgi:putative ABC transport system permease protein
MKFWQRALKSVTRRKGRSFILFLVIFILGNVIAGAVAIQQSTENVEKETKKQMGSQATVEMDYERFDKDQQKNPEKFEGDEWFTPPTMKELEAIGKLPYVKYYDMSISSYIGTNKFKGYTPEDGGSISYGMGAKYAINIKGVNRKEVVDLEEGIIKLESGETFTDKAIKEGENTVLISREVAEANNLSVGDQVAIDVTGEVMSTEIVDEDSEEPATPEVETFDFPVKVGGIFSVVKKENKEKSKDDGMGEDEWRAVEQINTIYMPNELVKALNKEQAQKIWKLSEEDLALQESEDYYQVTYVLKSIDDVEAFREEANALISNEYYEVFASTDQYDQIAGGMKKLGTISKYVVIIAALATILIISLVVLLFLRDRKHELGIYLSLGESRTEIIGQIVVELLLTSIIALVLSLVTGNLLGGAVSNSLLQTDWLSNSGDMMGYIGGYSLNTPSVSYEDIQSAYKVTFSVGYIISYLLLGLGTVLLSAILPLLYILRLNPKKIMM